MAAAVTIHGQLRHRHYPYANTYAYAYAYADSRYYTACSSVNL
jgi:hypothetical protein